jgi:hypothetical protein
MKTINELKNEIRIASFNFSQIENAVVNICENAYNNGLIIENNDHVIENEYESSIETIKRALFKLMAYEETRIEICENLINKLK